MQVKVPQAPQHREELWGLAHLLAELARPGIGVFHFRARLALGGDQRRPQGESATSSSCWARSGVSGRVREHLQPLREVR